MQSLRLHFLQKIEGFEPKYQTYVEHATEWAEAAKAILAASPNGLPPAANRCQSGENAMYQSVDSKTLTQNVMLLG